VATGFRLADKREAFARRSYAEAESDETTNRITGPMTRFSKLDETQSPRQAAMRPFKANRAAERTRALEQTRADQPSRVAPPTRYHEPARHE
jgi:hypothetical protein